MTVTRLVLLVEEESMRVALEALLPAVVRGVPHEVIVFQGKADLLRKLPSRLAGLRHEVPYGVRIAILLDRDDDDCRELVEKLRAAVQGAGLAVDRAGPRRGDVLCRVACEELEAWFLGDVAALCAAYPSVPPTLADRALFRDPDAVPGGTWERLERVLQDAGYYRDRFPKTKVAAEVARDMRVDRNRSHSFQVTISGLRRLVKVANA